MNQDPHSSPTTASGHSSAKSSPGQEDREGHARTDESSGCRSGLAPHPWPLPGFSGGDYSGGCGTEVACEVYEPLPAIMSKDMQNDEDVLEDGLPRRLWRWIPPLHQGFQRHILAGDIYDFKVKGLGELSHEDLTTALEFVGPCGNAVVEGDLIMIWTAPKTAHSSGHTELGRQIGNWAVANAPDSLGASTAERHEFTAAVPVQQQQATHSREPDISLYPLNSLAGDNPIQPRVVVELETEHRSARVMRDHYADYFTSPNVMAVLGVCYWETTRRAAAVLWVRQIAGGPSTVTQAVDFGIAPLTDHPVAGAQFDDPLQLGLPAVPPGVWVRWNCVVPPAPADQIPVYAPQNGQASPTITIPNACIIHQVNFGLHPVPVIDMEIDLRMLFKTLIHRK